MHTCFLNAFLLTQLAAGLPGPEAVVAPDTVPISEAAAAGSELRPGSSPVSDPVWLVSGTSVMEAAWTREEGGLLQVVAASVEGALWWGLRGRVGALAKWGHGGLPFPSSQGLSSLDAENFLGLWEGWLEWRGGDRVRVKAGWVDANTEFASVGSAGAFANPSFGLSPAMSILPSYPAPAPSVNLFVRLGRSAGDGPPGMEAGAGVYGREGGWSAVGQLAGAVPGSESFRWSAGWAVPLGGEPAGGWKAAEMGDGGYLILERPVEGFSPFLKLAASGPAEVVHLAAGLTLPLGVLPGDARLGLAGSRVHDTASGADVVAEAFLLLRPLPWLLVQPDVQVRFAPGLAPAPAALIRVALER